MPLGELHQLPMRDLNKLIGRYGILADDVRYDDLERLSRRRKLVVLLDFLGASTLAALARQTSATQVHTLRTPAPLRRALTFR